MTLSVVCFFFFFKKKAYVRDIQTDTFTHRDIIDRFTLRDTQRRTHTRANSEESFHADTDSDLFNRETERWKL